MWGFRCHLVCCCCKAVLTTLHVPGVKYAAILDRKTGKVLARSADIAFPDEYKVSKTERNAWQLIRIAGAKPKVTAVHETTERGALITNATLTNMSRLGRPT